MNNKILLCALALSALSANAAPTPSPGSDFAVPQRLVDIGGRKLALHCSGTGSPTVVFESPSGGAGWEWWRVQAKVAAKTRACTYDRAGYGFSDPSPRRADAANAVDDLHALLTAAGIAPPYVLAGNSFGGGAVQLFAWTHPDEVQGLVLVEPMHEDELLRPDALTHGQISGAEKEIIDFGDGCAAQAAKGFDPKSDAYDDCIGGPDPSLPPEVGALGVKMRLTPAWWRVRQAERVALATDREQLRAARKPFGDMPVIVLVRGVSPYLIPGQPQSDTNKAVESANLELLTAVARSSTKGEVRVVAGAGHVIQETHPDAVVTAVDDVLAKISR
ncbi:MAG: alpha/beta hydrolase [Burkholderiales bacterium]|nr:alpha/beta hydrolase [Burkholderiales bacterium]